MNVTPISIRLAVFLTNPPRGEKGRPKLDGVIWFLVSFLETFGRVALLIILAVLLSKLFPDFEALRTFIISGLIIGFLFRLAYLESYNDLIPEYFDVSEFKWRKYLPLPNSTNIFRKPVAIFRFLFLATIPALIFLGAGVELLSGAVDWAITKLS